jgi:hypothetical protein
VRRIGGDSLTKIRSPLLKKVLGASALVITSCPCPLFLRGGSPKNEGGDGGAGGGARRMSVLIEQRPITIVCVLRLCFLMSPMLNMLLSMTNIRFREYMIGSFLGLMPVLTVLVRLVPSLSPTYWPTPLCTRKPFTPVSRRRRPVAPVAVHRVPVGCDCRGGLCCHL